MTVIAIDIQPQYRFSCMAANEQYFLNEPENIVDELNRQARFSDKRLLVENVSPADESFCISCIDAPLGRSGQVFVRGEEAAACLKSSLLDGLPVPSAYDRIISIGNSRSGTCFTDSAETRSSGLME
ncbi:hypothetical protein [Neisseria perflava]|uniref:hypothetical protein n=1 Tax=Neisseria perflava TaxID=33053 RepID=UPI00209FD548|nr:hypothetical protein [Neisseria perflava]MCP1659739.1 hypothetical protein [Neisseria perflava]